VEPLSGAAEWSRCVEPLPIAVLRLKTNSSTITDAAGIIKSFFRAAPATGLFPGLAGEACTPMGLARLPAAP